MSAAEHAVTQGPKSGEYIQHHLQHLQKDFSFADVKQSSIVDFSVFNLDSVFFSVVLGILGCFFMWRAAPVSCAHLTLRMLCRMYRC